MRGGRRVQQAWRRGSSGYERDVTKQMVDDCQTIDLVHAASVGLFGVLAAPTPEPDRRAEIDSFLEGLVVPEGEGCRRMGRRKVAVCGARSRPFPE
jgi:hypothetical protein